MGRRIDIAGRTAGVLAGGLRPPARTYASRGLLALAALSMARSIVAMMLSPYAAARSADSVMSNEDARS